MNKEQSTGLVLLLTAGLFFFIGFGNENYFLIAAAIGCAAVGLKSMSAGNPDSN